MATVKGRGMAEDEGNAIQLSGDDLARLRAGELAAAWKCFARHQDRLKRAIAWRLDRRLGSRLDVSDILQETYAVALRRLAEYLRRPEMPFDLWLLWLAREQVQTAHRRHFGTDGRALGREVPALPVDSSACFIQGLLAQETSPSKAAVAAEAAEQLRQALSHLTEDELDLILWKHFEQLSHREIARLLGITEAAAAKRYIRAVERLRGLLHVE
jgi:RNA polymerase sigma-70 factor (ECF subfamily)